MAASKEVFDADAAEHDDGERGDAVEAGGDDGVGVAMRVPGGEIDEAVEAEHGEAQWDGGGGHAECGEEDSKDQTNIASEVGSICELCPEESSGAGHSSPEEHLCCAAQGHAWAVALELEEKCKRKPDARHAQGHGEDQRDDDAQGIAKAAREAPGEWRELRVQAAENGNVCGESLGHRSANGRP